jgi:hypothetical protein
LPCPGVHVLWFANKKDVNGRGRPGHDELESIRAEFLCRERRFLSWNLWGPHALGQSYQRGFSCEGFGMLIGALITFVVIILVLYLINLLPLDGRAKQIARVVVIIIGIISLLKYIAVI